MMCSYKVVHASFEVWGFQTKVEEFIHSSIREILLLGHRQAFTWIDEWYNMTLEEVREYEKKLNEETNKKVLEGQLTEQGEEAKENETVEAVSDKINDLD